MNTAWLKTRQTKFTAYVTIYILIVVAILAAVNFLANRYNKSVDTTANKRFSLSDQTVKVVKNLNQDAKITYFDKSSEFTRAKDLLDRYDTLSPKLKVDYIDPDKKPQVAKAMGVKNYGSIFVDVGAKHQEAKSLTEEEVTSALIRSVKGGERTACFVSGSGEHGIDDTGRTGYSQAKALIAADNYKTDTINLIGNKPEVPKTCTLIVVAGPKFDYSDTEVAAIRSYVEGGGRALILLDPPVKSGKDSTAPNAALVNVLGEWGAKPNGDVISDVIGLSEEIPVVTNYESHSIVRDFKGVATAFPLVQSLDIKSGDKSQVDKLFSTSARAVSVDPATGKKKSDGQFTLGAAGTYKGAQQGRFVVVGTSLFPSNAFIRFQGNGDLFANIIAWLSSDEELISIRPKDPEDRRLQLTRGQVSSIFMMSVVFLPLMSIIAGVAVWWRRR